MEIGPPTSPPNYFSNLKRSSSNKERTTVEFKQGDYYNDKLLMLQEDLDAFKLRDSEEPEPITFDQVPFFSSQEKECDYIKQQ